MADALTLSELSATLDVIRPGDTVAVSIPDDAEEDSLVQFRVILECMIESLDHALVAVSVTRKKEGNHG